MFNRQIYGNYSLTGLWQICSSGLFTSDKFVVIAPNLQLFSPPVKNNINFIWLI